MTIFGQSAGGASVNYLMLSDSTKGLFHKAIAMSGSALNPWAHQLNPEEVKHLTNKKSRYQEMKYQKNHLSISTLFSQISHYMKSVLNYCI